MTKPVVFRAGDTVRVIDPRVVTRVGYPQCVDDYLGDVDRLVGDEIEAIANKILGLPMLHKPSKTLDKVRRELALALARRDGFGGSERSIHLVEKPELMGMEARVVSVRSVMTGFYSPATGGRNYDGEYDYDPAYLADRKTVRVAELDIFVSEKALRPGVFRMRVESRPELPVSHLVRVQNPEVD